MTVEGRPIRVRLLLAVGEALGMSESTMKSGPVVGRPLEVTVDQDHVDRAINRLKRKMADEGILKELKKRRFYEKPSIKRKRKMREAERRRRKEMKRRLARAKGR